MKRSSNLIKIITPQGVNVGINVSGNSSKNYYLKSIELIKFKSK